MTKTVVIVGDSHFCETSRFEECMRLHREISDWCAGFKPDLLVHTGDLFDRKTTPNERIAAARWLQACAEFCPVVVVGGNHDLERELSLMNCLRCNYLIETWERPTSDTVVVGGVELALLPWPRKAHLLAALGDVSQETAGQAAQEALRNVLRGMTRASKLPFLFAGHVMMSGSLTSTGQPLIGVDLELGLEDLALVGADAYALGHVHMRQAWDIDTAPCFYPGSPRRTAYGEVEDKGFTVVRFDWDPANGPRGMWRAETEFVKLSAAPMLLATAVYDGTSLVVDESEFFAKFDEGCEIRLRFKCDSDHQAAAKAAAQAIKAKWLEWGATSVQLEPEVNVTTRARALEVAAATTLQEQVAAYWRAKCYNPETRRDALLGKLATLEGESL
jgi:exonuclease SbcD